jgi:hypothetical protein
VLLLILTPLVFIGALWTSTRRRTLLQLNIGGMLGLIVARPAARWNSPRSARAARTGGP